MQSLCNSVEAQNAQKAAAVKLIDDLIAENGNQVDTREFLLSHFRLVSEDDKNNSYPCVTCNWNGKSSGYSRLREHVSGVKSSDASDGRRGCKPCQHRHEFVKNRLRL